MRLRLFLSLLAIVVGTLVVAALGATALMDRLLDRHLQGLVEGESLALKSDILRALENQGLIDGSGLSPPASDEAALIRARLAVVTSMVEHYRLGGRGYAWLIDDKGVMRASGQEAATVAPEVYAADRDELGRLVERTGSGQAATLSGGAPRVAAWSQLPEVRMVLGVTYPMTDVNTLVQGYRQGIWMMMMWVAVLGLVGTYVLANRLGSFHDDVVRMVNALGDRSRWPDVQVHDADLTAVKSLLDDVHRRLVEPRVELSPLTGLPGRKALEQQLFDRIDRNLPMAVGLVDGTAFTAYNNKYGYSKGDSLIRFLGTLVVNAVREHGDADDYISHLGGDHFVFVTTPEKASSISAAIIDEFDRQIPHYYAPEDRERGCMVSKDRQGNIQVFPLMRMTIGVATNKVRPLIHPLQIAAICSEVREYVKTQGKSAYMVDRRAQERDNKTDTAGFDAPSNGSDASPVAQEQGAEPAGS